MTSVFIEDRGLFVHGGQYTKGTQSVATSMTFSLDLSTPWETNQPKYTLMTMEGPTDYKLTSVLFTDNNGWLMVSNATGSNLRLDNLVWSEVSFGANIMNKDRGLAAATDPITGSMYIINGGVQNGVKRTFTYNEVINQY
ncbi:hypothetical protein BGX24_010615 [Mortierella sp. AD032]|nr:hypothetical protein BGX24_010615 [Mortierella sp. AD032]